DALQLRFEGSNTFALNRSLIHAGGVEIAYLLLNGVAIRTVNCGFLQNVTQDKTIALGQFSIASVGGLIARDGILLEPSAAGILVEITTGVGGLVHQCRIEASQF